jgi:hypothetical protein
LQLALLNSPDASAKIIALYEQIEAVYEAERLRYQNMCCVLCGEQKCVRDVMGFEPDLAPNLCIYHGAGWNASYTRFRDGWKTEHFFAKWLAKQVLKEARKIKGKENDKDSTDAPRSPTVEREGCSTRD